MAKCYTVVENAGYEGEREVRTAFSTSTAAWEWAERHYGMRKMEELHVMVRKDTNGLRTYEY